MARWTCRSVFIVGCFALAGAGPRLGARPPRGLDLSLQLDATSYALGQPIFLLAELRNRSDKAIRARLPKRELAEFRL